ncbi:MAG: conjugal transfer protein TraH, partial [Proteobacteria bacterium]|nr:conjugal transfer protein TraH [Pseudomonadota bacterium]
MVVLIFFVKNSYASSMGEFWNSLGGVSNISDARYVKGQKAGHVALGSVQMRSNIQNAQLASINMPSLSMGCGGIDFYAGGFSFINSGQLISLMKSIASNAQGPLLQMAIDNLCPKCGAIIKKFEDVAREVNSLNINSCQAANALIKSPGSIVNSAKSHACRTVGAGKNLFTDASDARESCTSGGQATSTVKSLSESEKDQIPVDVNIAWKSLKDSGLVSMASDADVELAELMMTLSGTIILRDANNDDGAPAIEPV